MTEQTRTGPQAPHRKLRLRAADDFLHSHAQQRGRPSQTSVLMAKHSLVSQLELDSMQLSLEMLSLSMHR